MDEWAERGIPVPLKVLHSSYRELTRPVIEYISEIHRESPRTVVAVFIPEYVVGHWWEQLLAQPERPAPQGAAAVPARGDGDERALAAGFRRGAGGSTGRRDPRRIRRRGHPSGCGTLISWSSRRTWIGLGEPADHHLPPSAGGLSRKRRLIGLVACVAGLPALTGVLVAVRDEVSLNSVLLIYLLAVVVIPLPGIGSVILNEQIPGGDGIDTSSLTVNMIHVVLTGVVDRRHHRRLGAQRRDCDVDDGADAHPDADLRRPLPSGHADRASATRGRR